MKHEIERCGMCRFFEPAKGGAGFSAATDPGLCHIRAPTAMGKFPSVRALDWCGEFQVEYRKSKKEEQEEIDERAFTRVRA